jgi:hypothetical protein
MYANNIPLFGLREQYCTSCAVELWIASLCYVDYYYPFVWDLDLSSSMLSLSETNGVSTLSASVTLLTRKSAFRAWVISGHVLEKVNNSR